MLLQSVTKCYKSVKCCYKVLQKCQFSYLQGSKRNGEYSSDFVNLSKETSNIGAFCNWFEIVNDSNTNDESVCFKPSHVFTQVYSPLTHHSKISNEYLRYEEVNSFLILRICLDIAMKDWREKLQI